MFRGMCNGGSCGGCGCHSCGSGCGTYSAEDKAKWLKKKEEMLEQHLEEVRKAQKELASTSAK